MRLIKVVQYRGEVVGGSSSVSELRGFKVDVQTCLVLKEIDNANVEMVRADA